MPPNDKRTPTTGCGCYMDTVTDDDPSDLCSEGTGMFDGVSWIMRMCPMHRAAPDLLEACQVAVRSAHHPACPIATGKGQTTITGDDCTCHVKAARDALAKVTNTPTKTASAMEG